ncbi:tetratricopeptide repeat protein 8-like [Gouania willdenowi]|uniref:tetratricopeptide repeat protein 8-like n=1 Tax=Gouania willdenowi TaxID=441366 RepID=UPI00105496A2|nr:tetratricopeptide repeat protein 8-like [Gouania willdenowi]
MEVTMDPLFIAWSYFRRRKLQQCSDICSKILEENPYDQDSSLFISEAAWGLKTCALTEMVYIDEVEVDQEGIAEMMLDESSIAQVAQPSFPLNILVLKDCIIPSNRVNHNITSATEYYKDVLKQDNTHVEAIACIGSNHFYTDQPEIALRFYRRLLQMGVYNCQLYNNLALCCFYAQQYDMTLSSFERALALVANDEELADVWYNVGHVAVGIGDLTLAYQSFKLALAFNNDHAEAYNNLAVLELRRGHIQQSKAFQADCCVTCVSHVRTALQPLHSL